MRDWRAVNALFLVTTILDGIAGGHLTAFTPLMLREIGLESTDIGLWSGLLYGTMLAIAFPLAPFWGALSERFSHRLIIARSQYLAALAYVVTALSGNVWGLLVARVVLGFTFGHVATVIAAQSLLTPRRHVGKAIATIQSAAPIAASFGPPLGAALVDHLGLRGLLWLDAALALAAALLITFVMPEPEGTRSKVSIVGRTRQVAGIVCREPALRWNYIAWFTGQGGRVVVDVYLPVRITQLSASPASDIGYVLGVFGALAAVATWLAGRLADAASATRWLVAAMLLGAVSVLGILTAPSLWVLAGWAWIRALPHAAYQTLLYGHLVRVVDPRHQSPVMAMTPVPRNVAAFVFPTIAAAASAVSVPAGLGVGAAAYLCTAAAGLMLVRWSTAPAHPARDAAQAEPTR
ncbi:MAG: MFS transporter [Chloroflexota bacterium]